LAIRASESESSLAGNAISGAVVDAKHLATAARFYELVLGADVVHESADHVVIQTPPSMRDDTPIKLFLTVATLAEARTQASSLGGGLVAGLAAAQAKR
jgi:catechol-2,3-dioxygenase